MNIHFGRGPLQAIVLGAFLAAPAGTAAQGTANGEWRTYGGDIANTRYAALDQITADNFADLEVAWRFSTANLGPETEYNLQATPLMVDGVLFSTGGTRRAAFAIDAGTGELLWIHRVDEGERAEVSPRRRSGRGLAYRDDGGDGQIFYVTTGYRLIGLNARTGERLAGFGDNGMVDLMQNMDQEIDPLSGEIGLHSAPLVAGDTIVVGAAHVPGSAPRSMRNTKGYVRGFDAGTGVRKWIFHTIPGADEYGNDSWLNDSWRYTGNTGVWGQMSADLELGIVYFATEMPTNDYYGGHRHGDNLFSDSIVAVDIDSGERLWHFQVIRHDVWDWDFPCAPILADVVIDGVERKLLVQPSKQAWLYVFDRVTGEPIWPIEEREMPPSDVPGELLARTQPFPTHPPPYDRQGVSEDDLIDFTPELRAEALELVSNFRMGPIFTPPVVADPEGPYGTLMLPSTGGGTNWPGGSLDPETNIFYGYSYTRIVSLGLVNDPERSDMDFIRGNQPGVPA
ncbi:MAG: PQQ-binding-like beta-propeller repeat protein, partial [Acidobacteria bacterium]|nr:PQQ-binding-like beta-propeller repeat protein [Acidobacteriota bacterium]